MILNIGIVLFIIGIAYWQGVQGFFSAFLHLMLVIISGTLAFAFWEPVSMGMLSGMMPRYAWAIGLVMPFVFFLLLTRFLMDKFVPANTDFSQLTNLLAGGICGAIAAVLSAGIFLIGTSYLPGATDNFGYKPYTIDQNTGAVVANNEGGSLWIGVDSIAEGFFSKLSTGTFAPASGRSLARHQPQIVQRAALIRLRGDANSSTSTTPGAVTITAHYDSPTPMETLPEDMVKGLRRHGETDYPNMIAKEGHRIVAIETHWTNSNQDKTFDGDPRLRVFPTQVQLVSFAKDRAADGPPMLHLPFAFSRLRDPVTNNREFTVVNNDAAVAMTDSGADAKLTWLFLLPANQEENYLLVRNLRLPLPNAATAIKTPDPVALLALIGQGNMPVAVATHTNPDNGTTPTTPTPGTVGEKQGGRSGIKAEDLEVTGALPIPTSRTLAIGLEFTPQNEIRRGESVIKRSTGPISINNSVTKFHATDGQAVVRIKMAKDTAQSFLGQAAAAAGGLHPIIMRDDRGNDWRPMGYVWLETASRTMNVRFEPQRPIGAVRELPIREMSEVDELYVYFLVEKGVTLLSFQVGTVHTQDIDRVEVK